MENQSARHHYIPRFYINNFCTPKGNIFINDKDDSRNYLNVSSKYPKSVFYEWNSNTFEVDGVDTTVIEKIYRDIENKIAPYLNGLVNSTGNEDIGVMNVETLRNLIYLGYLTKWRVPVNNDFVDELTSEVSFDDLNIFAKTENEIFSLNEAWPSSISPGIKRLLFPTLLFNHKDDYSKVFKNTFVISFQEPLFLTDNPFVEFTIDKEKDFPSFIFPLSSYLLLVHCDFIDKMEFADFISKCSHGEGYLRYLYNCIQITLMWHAQKNIGCESKEHLKYYLSVASEISDGIEERKGSPPFVAFTALANFKTFR